MDLDEKRQDLGGKTNVILNHDDPAQVSQKIL